MVRHEQLLVVLAGGFAFQRAKNFDIGGGVETVGEPGWALFCRPDVPRRVGDRVEWDAAAVFEENRDHMSVRECFG